MGSMEQAERSPTRRRPRWITCSSSNELEGVIGHCIPTTIEDVVVAELGAQLRTVSTALIERCHHAVLVDVKRQFPSSSSASSNNTTRTKAMRRQGDERHLPSHVTFVEIDTLDDWRNAFAKHREKYDIFVVDVNSIVGNDLDLTALSIVRDFTARFQTSTVFIKSERLNQWAYRLAPSQQRPNGTATILAAVGVKEYRQTIASTVKPGDAVLEVGCHLGTTTKLLYQACLVDGAAHCMGVDVGSKIVTAAQQQSPHMYFAVGDAWKTAELLRIQQQFLQRNSHIPTRMGFDVVYVDVGGLSGSDGLFEALALLSALQNALEPRMIVIKSVCVQRLASQLVPAFQLMQKQKLSST